MGVSYQIVGQEGACGPVFSDAAPGPQLVKLGCGDLLKLRES